MDIVEHSYGTYRKANSSLENFTFCYKFNPLQDNDLIDVSQINFDDHENWLYKSPLAPKTNLSTWLQNCIKNIDTRTFTRPKKQYNRPSIQKFNEEWNGEFQEEQPKQDHEPLHFDLEQTQSSGYLDHILTNAPIAESFQNMSPPSLVNSMTSSIFSNLMESSFIKNDPELREIRDTDYTILLQEEEPLFQSITESLSSVNSDIPENFLKKMSYNTNNDSDHTLMNVTFEKKNVPCDDTKIMNDDLKKPTTNLTKVIQCNELNSTYQKSGKNLYETVTIDHSPIIVKRLLDRRASPSLDLNRMCYLDGRNEFNNKRNSFGSSDSDNLDYMSLSSSSSKISERIQSLEAINTISEFSVNLPKTTKFNEIMSTPKPGGQPFNIWSNQHISPDRNSDPELSSSELQIGNTIRKQKSVGHLVPKLPTQKSVNTVSRADTYTLKNSPTYFKKMPQVPPPPPSKQTNLNSMGRTLKGSYTSLRPTMHRNLPVAPPPLTTTFTMCQGKSVQVPSIVKEVPKSDAQFVKQPSSARRSGLPRPVTGRTVSKIPGPKTLKFVGSQGKF